MLHSPAVIVALLVLAASPAGPAPEGLVFGARTGAVLNFVKADQVEVFEAALAELRRALASSDNPVRRQQADGWRFLKAAEPGPQGTAVFVFFVEPVLRGADYSVRAVLEDAFGEDEARKVSQGFADSLAAPQSVLNLTLVADMAPPPRKPAPRRR